MSFSEPLLLRPLWFYYCVFSVVVYGLNKRENNPWTPPESCLFLQLGGQFWSNIRDFVQSPPGCHAVKAWNVYMTALTLCNFFSVSVHGQSWRHFLFCVITYTSRPQLLQQSWITFPTHGHLYFIRSFMFLCTFVKRTMTNRFFVSPHLFHGVYRSLPLSAGVALSGQHLYALHGAASL